MSFFKVAATYTSLARQYYFAEYYCKSLKVYSDLKYVHWAVKISHNYYTKLIKNKIIRQKMEISMAEFLDYKADDNEYDIGWEYSDIMQFGK